MYNSATWIPETLKSIGTAISNSQWSDYEILIVDDGSTDNLIATLAEYKGVRYKIFQQENLGRFSARKNGLQNSTGTHILFIDSRVRINYNSLNVAFSDCRKYSALTAHINYSDDSGLLGFFWSAAEVLVWWRYWINPHKVLIIENNFHKYPKGTTCLIMGKEVAVQAFENFESKFEDLRNSSDDTELLDFVAKNYGIYLNPDYNATYFPRSMYKSAMRHAFHRGTVFFDGHVSRNSSIAIYLYVTIGIIGSLTAINMIYPQSVYFFAAAVFLLNVLLLLVLTKLRWKRWISLYLYLPSFGLYWLAGLLKGIYLGFMSRKKANV